MSRLSLSIACASSLLLIAGCGSSASVTAKGEFGKQPQIDLPAKTPTKLTVSTPISGSGAKIAKNNLVTANVLAKVVRGGTTLVDTYTAKTPVTFPMTQGQLLPGWEKALLGKRSGSRVVILAPPAEAFGDQGLPQLKVTKTDSIVAVFDITHVYGAKSSADGTPVDNIPGALPLVNGLDGKKPKIIFPDKYSPTDKLVVQPLLKGAGETLESGDQLIAQYVGVIAASGKEFDSSWKRGAPAQFPVGTGGVIKGWDQGLVGQKIGSRVLLVIPPALGYGSAGNSQAGIKGTDTLVFVVDLLGRVAAPKA